MQQSLIKNSGYILFNNIIERGCYFLFYLILARKLSIEEFGFISTIFAVVNILNSVFDFGFPFYIQRETSFQKEIEKKVNTILSFKVLTLFFFFPIPFLYFNENFEEGFYVILLITLINILQSITLFFNSIFYGGRFYKESFKVLTYSRISFFIFLLLLSTFPVASEFFLVPFLTSYVIQLLLLLISLQKKEINIKLIIPDWVLLKSIMKSSMKIGIGLIFVLIYDRVDILIIEEILGLTYVGFYSVAYSIYRAIQIFSGAYLINLFTDFSYSYANNKQIVFKQIVKSVLFLIMLSVVVIIIMLFFSETIINLLYGSKYEISAYLLFVLCLGLPALFLNNLTGVISNSIYQENIPLYSTGIGAISNIILNFILINSYGIIGAVIATIVTEYIVFIIQLVMLYLKNKKVTFIVFSK